MTKGRKDAFRFFQGAVNLLLPFVGIWWDYYFASKSAHRIPDQVDPGHVCLAAAVRSTLVLLASIITIIILNHFSLLPALHTLGAIADFIIGVLWLPFWLTRMSTTLAMSNYLPGYAEISLAEGVSQSKTQLYFDFFGESLGFNVDNYRKNPTWKIAFLKEMGGLVKLLFPFVGAWWDYYLRRNESTPGIHLAVALISTIVITTIFLLYHYSILPAFSVLPALGTVGSMAGYLFVFFWLPCWGARMLTASAMISSLPSTDEFNLPAHSNNSAQIQEQKPLKKPLNERPPLSKKKSLSRSASSKAVISAPLTREKTLRKSFRQSLIGLNLDSYIRTIDQRPKLSQLDLGASQRSGLGKRTGSHSVEGSPVHRKGSGSGSPGGPRGIDTSMPSRPPIALRLPSRAKKAVAVVSIELQTPAGAVVGAAVIQPPIPPGMSQNPHGVTTRLGSSPARGHRPPQHEPPPLPGTPDTPASDAPASTDKKDGLGY